MTAIKAIIAIIVITMALTLILTAKISDPSPNEPASSKSSKAGKRVGRFLQQKEKNPRAGDHCNKDNEVCNYTLESGRNATCCKNKCMDLSEDADNCGACDKKCDYTDSCCRGECVNLSFDKRHCGWCNNRCNPGGLCLYGMCDYA